MNTLVDFENEYLKSVLPILLHDHTTGKNIIWGTDGEGHKASDEITLNDVKNICPRVLKRLDEQKKRTRNKAEVFTPTHICKKMNDLLDEDRKDVKWFVYIRQTVLEITCGEAPFIASRYDTTTGEMIPVSKRIGILDRKLSRIPECPACYNDPMLFGYICEALLSTYGYEYQGDNLLLARCNVFLTVLEHVSWRNGGVQDNFSTDSMNKFANIISRNFWQMDGLTGCVPGTNIPCVIIDWENDDKQVLFNDLKKESEPNNEAAGNGNRL